jgi:hypothetical protein
MILYMLSWVSYAIPPRDFMGKLRYFLVMSGHTTNSIDHLSKNCLLYCNSLNGFCGVAHERNDFHFAIGGCQTAQLVGVQWISSTQLDVCHVVLRRLVLFVGQTLC